nr:hypothetical protein Iba_chr06aCG14960 [Ipomoea batatas]
MPRYCENCCCIGHSVTNCRRRRNERPPVCMNGAMREMEGEACVEERVRDPAMAEGYVDRDTPPVCGNATMEHGLVNVEYVNAHGVIETMGDPGRPSACVQDRTGELTAPFKEMEAGAVVQGLEELARKGISIDQFVGESILEAAKNVIEETTDKVVREVEIDVALLNVPVLNRKVSIPTVCEDVHLSNDGQQLENGNVRKDQATGAAILNAPVANSEKVIDESTNMIKEMEGNVSKGVGVVNSGNNHQQEKGNSSSRGDSLQRMAMNASKSEKCVTPKVKGNGDMSARKFFEHFSKAMTALIQESIEKKGRKGKEGRAESSIQTREKDMSEGSKKGEMVFKNTMEWVDVVEEYMKKDKGFEQKVKEALKEVNAYLWTVYDKEKEEYVEEGKNRAMRAATIFLVKLAAVTAMELQTELMHILSGSAAV